MPILSDPQKTRIIAIKRIVQAIAFGNVQDDPPDQMSGFFGNKDGCFARLLAGELPFEVLSVVLMGRPVQLACVRRFAPADVHGGWVR